ncbi:MAG: NAD(P)/FAD-dependent oxidoreductase, partial [Nitrospirota bacterium]
MKETDVIIVGSGMGGLTCGALLAKNGLNTMIVEQHFKPGGYVTSYKRDGFLFDVVHVIGGLRDGAPLERIFSYLGLNDKIRFVEVEKTFRFVYPDVTIDCYTDMYKYEQELFDNFPGEKEGIHRYIRTSKRIWEEILNSYYRPHVLQLLSYPVRFPNLVRFRNKTHQEFLDTFFRNEKLKEILGSGWGYLGLNNPRISALYLIGMYMSYHHGGAWHPVGGYQSMSDAFAQCFRENGGILRLKTKVKRILVENNRAVGVELDDGEQLRARCVISNADTKRTFLDLVGEERLEKGFPERVKRLQQSVSGFVVHLGVRMELPEDLHCGCVMYFPDYGIAEDQFRSAARNEIVTAPGKFGVGLSVATLKDPGLAPAGCHALDIIYMPAPYGYEHNWMREDRTKYNELKEKTADTLIGAAEKLIPGLSRHIVVKDINTPLTYERYTSATEGGWYDSACTPGQSLRNRMTAKTPVRNLYLTGAKSFPGPGMFGAIQSGLFTADIILNGKL